MEGLSEQLELLRPETILEAEKKYRKFYSTRDEKNLLDPTAILEEINYKKEQFSKLKFQYLELETREKFLRGILDNPPLYVEQTDIDAKLEDNQEIKNELNAKKLKSETLQNETKDLAREVVALHNEYQDKAKEAEGMVEEIEAMEREIELLSRENPTVAEIMKHSLALNEDQIVDEKSQTKTFTGNVDKIRNQMNQEMSINEAQLLKLHTEVALKEELMESQDRSIIDLQQKLDQLEQDLLCSQQESQEVTQDQLLAQWLKEMNEIWSKYFLGKVRVGVEHINTNNQYKITVEIVEKWPFDLFVKAYDLRNCEILLVDGLQSETLLKIKNFKSSMSIGRIGLLISEIIDRETRR